MSKQMAWNFDNETFLIKPVGTNFSEILIEILHFYTRKCIQKYHMEHEMANLLSWPQCFNGQREIIDCGSIKCGLINLCNENCNSIWHSSWFMVIEHVVVSPDYYTDWTQKIRWRIFGYVHFLLVRITCVPFCMMTSSNGNILRVTGPLCSEFTGLRPVTRSFDDFFLSAPN